MRALKESYDGCDGRFTCSRYTGWERTVHMTLCLDLYSEQILVSCYDLENCQCFLSVYLIFWT